MQSGFLGMDGGGHVPGVKTPGLVDARNAQAEAWAYLEAVMNFEGSPINSISCSGSTLGNFGLQVL
jgi:hypothetical protein